jgi:hypothetical protein
MVRSHAFPDAEVATTVDEAREIYSSPVNGSPHPGLAVLDVEDSESVYHPPAFSPLIQDSLARALPTRDPGDRDDATALGLEAVSGGHDAAGRHVHPCGRSSAARRTSAAPEGSQVPGDRPC